MRHGDTNANCFARTNRAKWLKGYMDTLSSIDWDRVSKVKTCFISPSPSFFLLSLFILPCSFQIKLANSICTLLTLPRVFLLKAKHSHKSPRLIHLWTYNSSNSSDTHSSLLQRNKNIHSIRPSFGYWVLQWMNVNSGKCRIVWRGPLSHLPFLPSPIRPLSLWLSSLLPSFSLFPLSITQSQFTHAFHCATRQLSVCGIQLNRFDTFHSHA